MGTGYPVRFSLAGENSDACQPEWPQDNESRAKSRGWSHYSNEQSNVQLGKSSIASCQPRITDPKSQGHVIRLPFSQPGPRRLLLLKSRKVWSSSGLSSGKLEVRARVREHPASSYMKKFVSLTLPHWQPSHLEVGDLIPYVSSQYFSAAKASSIAFLLIRKQVCQLWKSNSSRHLFSYLNSMLATSYPIPTDTTWTLLHVRGQAPLPSQKGHYPRPMSLYPNRSDRCPGNKGGKNEEEPGEELCGRKTVQRIGQAKFMS
ncbi:hypothetical protein EDB92DRAFT_1817089 [Lactarius akahatsu]|uniref:Uncharacterized protein n=1 Tax=Lactarius akahatsu TaxID=416441 RepID=A0AAD4Q773_9AGAM|nr:hypothetical protein EDB92DRAFT_1817089 [Lactarius akahatsu]